MASSLSIQLPLKVGLSKSKRWNSNQKLYLKIKSFQGSKSIMKDYVCSYKQISEDVKFVKNELLMVLLSQGEEQTLTGVLTMDNQHRFLVLDSVQSSQYPIIGFWKFESSSQGLMENQEMLQVTEKYLKSQFNSKCLFIDSLNHQYFYYVTLAKRSIPKVYLIKWQELEFGICQKLPKNHNGAKVFESHTELSTPSNTKRLSHDLLCLLEEDSVEKLDSEPFSEGSYGKEQTEQNGMEFTLKDKNFSHKQKQTLPTLESLVNYSYISPIKQLSPAQKQSYSEHQTDFVANFFRKESGSQQSSPDFSTNKAENTQKIQECCSNCQNIKQQNQRLIERCSDHEQQIQRLKAIISNIQSEFTQYKKSRTWSGATQCDSHQAQSKVAAKGQEKDTLKSTVHLFLSSPSENNSSEFAINSNSRSVNNLSSPREVRRLRQSDLKSNTNSNSSSSRDWVKNSSNKKSLNSNGIQAGKLLSFDHLNPNSLVFGKGLNSNNMLERQNPNVQNKHINPYQSDKENISSNSGTQKEIVTFRASSEEQTDLWKNTSSSIKKPLPDIEQQDNRDPWEYMEIVQS